MSFGGTDGIFDVFEDAWQGTMGAYSPQYLQAMRIADELRNVKAIRSNISIAGHSLGGGMASAAACVSGFKAYTFNAAGLSATTIFGNMDSPGYRAYIAEMSSRTTTLVDAYYMDYCLLSFVQDSSWIARNALGKRIKLNSQYDLRLGSIGPIVHYAASWGLDWITFMTIVGSSLEPMANAHRMNAIYYGLLVDENWHGSIVTDHYGYTK